MSTSTGNFGEWSICYQQYDAADEDRREALLALGNGYLVSRAAAPESSEDEVHYPGTYRVGCYNRLSTPIEGKTVEIESLVNLPNWLPLTFRVTGESWFSLEEVEILSYCQELHLDQAFLERNIRFRSKEGRVSSLYERRFVSMAQQHLMLMQQEIRAENWSGTLEIRSALDGGVQNNNVARYAPFRKRHLETQSVERVGNDGLELLSRTVQSGIDIALLARTRLRRHGNIINCSRSTQTEADCIAEIMHTHVNKGETVNIEKVATLYTSHDPALSDCRESAREALEEAQDFEELFKAHSNAWKKLWQRCQLQVLPAEQLPFFRLHMFQILQNISLHTADLDVGVPPSGWQGEEYFGQIFWDEMFIFPFLTYRFPTIARSLLLYRHRRLNAARSLAKKGGYKGALYPWRSASSGREETPLLQYNLYSEHWMEDYTYLQHHIGGIIAYSICNYVEVTGDKLFMAEYGAEMLLEIARFWASLAQFNPQLGRYEIKRIVGPDEHHTHNPGANTANPSERGIHNNTYTNVLAAWTLTRAGQMFQKLTTQQQQTLMETLDFSANELDQWDTISRNMYLVVLEDGTPDQFEGFQQLQDFDLEAFRREWGQKRVDWTLEHKGDSIVRYKLSKQADTSLLLYLFRPSELQNILKHMGYEFSLEQLKKTVEHQIAHTANESSLSRIIHAGALAQLDREASWKFFRKAQLIDLKPKEDDDSSEGIHLGAMGGTLGVLQHHYLGIAVEENTLTIHPELPGELTVVTLDLTFLGVELSFKVNHQLIWVKSINSESASIEIKHGNDSRTLQGGVSISFPLKN